MAQLYDNLKKMKISLKELYNSQISDMDARFFSLKDRLLRIQEQIQNHPYNTDLHIEERRVRNEVADIAKARASYLQQVPLVTRRMTMVNVHALKLESLLHFVCFISLFGLPETVRSHVDCSIVRKGPVVSNTHISRVHPSRRGGTSLAWLLLVSSMNCGYIGMIL